VSAKPAVEVLIDLFRGSAFWNDYCAAASPDSGEEVLRRRWLQPGVVDRWLIQGQERLTWCLSTIEQQFLNSFAELVRGGGIRVWHRLLAKHHATAEHNLTPAEMLDNAGICVDRGEILVKPSRTPPIKLVRITASKPTEAELDEIVRAYHRRCVERAVRPSLNKLTDETGLPLRSLRKAWLGAGFKLQHGGHR
jgi:hypothetical protein